jgi:hypothetical protein
MQKLNFTWKVKTGQYQNGEYLYLNKINIGSCDWNTGQSKGDTNNNYVGSLYLPSLIDKNKRIYSNDQKLIKDKMEVITTNWFNEALKNEAQNE